MSAKHHNVDDSGELEQLEDIRLTEEQIQRIARIAARTALNQVYAEVGQSVLRKAAWLLGVALLALLIFLAGKQALPPIVGKP